MITKTYPEKRFFDWEEDDVSVSLRACSGSYGGGSEVLIISYIQTSSDLSKQGISKAQETNMLKKGNW
jgi:hypothetical protein